MSILFYIVQSLNSMQREDMSRRKYESSYFQWLMHSFPNTKLGTLRVTAGSLLRGISNAAANTSSHWLYKILSIFCQMSVTSYENTNPHWITSKMIISAKRISIISVKQNKTGYTIKIVLNLRLKSQVIL